MAGQEPVLGSGVLSSSVHDAAQRAADLLAVLLPGPGCPAGRAELIAVLRKYGEPEPIEISAADLADLRQAALDLREVFAAGDAGTAADRLNGLLASRAHPPRLTSHDGTSGWHVHVDGDDDAPWADWFLTSSCLALAVLLAERQAAPAGLCAAPSCGRPFVNVGRGAVRRYCSAACGTRDRVARHRAIQAGTSETAVP
jgi:predicted RNA-binding Zn ribbon-like protein